MKAAPTGQAQDDRINKLRAENEALAQALTEKKPQAAEGPPDATNRISELETKLGKVQGLLDAAHEAHAHALAAAQTQAKEKISKKLEKLQQKLLDAHQSELSALQAEVKCTMEEQAAAQAEATSVLESRLNVCAADIAKKEAEIAEATAKANAMDARAAALETIVAELRAESVTSEAALKKAQVLESALG